MTILVVLALISGILCGQGLLNDNAILFITSNSELILNILMFTVGISVGCNKSVFQRLRHTDHRVWFVPVGVILGSVLGGLLCSLVNKMTLAENLCISSGLGWYSLSGVLLTDFFTSNIGAVAFFANLMREFLSFVTIPYVSRKMNGYAAIALAGATSEDTTLPIIIRHNPEEMVIYSVINGVLTSAAVPMLIRFFYRTLG